MVASGTGRLALPLQTQRTEVVGRMRARLGFLLLAPLFVAAVFVTPQLVTATYAEPFPFTPRSDAGTEPSEDGAIDVYGNEVTLAVAKYTFDDTGTLYELHSPQTELPRLAPPKS